MNGSESIIINYLQKRIRIVGLRPSLHPFRGHLHAIPSGHPFLWTRCIPLPQEHVLLEESSFKAWHQRTVADESARSRHSSPYETSSDKGYTTGTGLGTAAIAIQIKSSKNRNVEIRNPSALNITSFFDIKAYVLTLNCSACAVTISFAW